MRVPISQVNLPSLFRCMTLEYRKAIIPALPVTENQKIHFRLCHVLSCKVQLLEVRYRMDFSSDVYYAFSLPIQINLLKNKEN
jgi:hypothetical protein